jgi:hypothetical protein
VPGVDSLADAVEQGDTRLSRGCSHSLVLLLPDSPELDQIERL